MTDYKPKIQTANKSTYIMLAAGLLLQLITFIITKDTWLAFISGIAGVFSVVFCSERRMSYYLWSFIQIATFSVICFNENLYGKLLEQLFYLVTLGIGVGTWLANKDKDNKVQTRSLNTDGIVKCLILGMVGWVLLYIPMAFCNDPAPLLDSITTILAIIAQVLMILRYKENWTLWFVVDILCILLFMHTENWCMVAQYAFWTINTIYGYWEWNRVAKPNDKYFKTC